MAKDGPEKGEKCQCKKHWNQLRPRHTTEIMENTKDITMEVLYDAFKIPISVRQRSQMDVSLTSRLKIPVCQRPPLQEGLR